MTLKLLKTSAALIALTAGGALADNHSASDAMQSEEMQQSQTEAERSDGELLLDQEAQEGDAPIRYTEENVREATEGQVNVADGGETDFSGTNPQLSGDVDDEGTIATDEYRETADLPVDADKELVGGETTTAEVIAQQETDPEYGQAFISDEFGGMTAGDLVGLRVYDAEGARTGEVEEIVDLNGEMTVIVGLGGFLGFGEDEYAVSLDQFHKGGTDELRLIEMTEEELTSQPQFEGDAAEPVARNARVDEAL